MTQAPWYERLSTLDSMFLNLEDRSAHMHVGALVLFDGAPPSYREVLALIESRLQHVPRYRQRLMTVPLGQGRPVWLGEFAPPTLAAQAARLSAVTRVFNVLITDVPGPQFPLYFLGRRMAECYPVPPLAANTALGIALLSYDGAIDVGLLGDAEATKDLATLGGAVREAAAESLGVSQSATATSAH